MRKIPFLDIRGQDEPLRQEILRELQEVCQTCQFALGDKVKAFEQAFAEFCGVQHCVGLNSGTSALHLAMRCLDIGPGDEVVSVPMTFIATVWGAMYVGAKPVFVDVDPATRNMDPARLEAAITPRTKAIIPVHLYGQPADLDPILEIASRHGIPVVEDAAQAHGARYKGRPAGSIGRIGCFSFYPGKNLGAYGEGGALVTNDAGIAARARALRDHGQAERYHHAEIGYNYRLEGFQGAVLGIKLRHLPAWSEQRRRVAARYNERLMPLAKDGVLETPTEKTWSQGVYHLYVILVKDRDKVRDRLQEAGIATGLHYPIPLHLQEALAHLGGRRGDFPAAERIADRCISLPMFPQLTMDDVDYVADRLVHILT